MKSAPHPSYSPDLALSVSSLRVWQEMSRRPLIRGADQLLAAVKGVLEGIEK
jgi:hypothetical protein